LQFQLIGINICVSRDMNIVFSPALHRDYKDKMAEPNLQGGKNSAATANKAVTDYVDRLGQECRMLVILKTQLYGGSWEPMLDDLRNRLNGRPYIFKLANRIQDDIERIEQMREFEAKQGIDLADFIQTA